ncbi:hypothetical protein COE51_05690 [Bacillus pseudomycoides]|nr:hypothetical protein COE51_05690 [Bacillus pseudomycoides]
MRRFRRTYNFSAPSWLRNIQTMFSDFAIPLTIFQGIRTLLLPTLLDFVILAIFIAATIRLHYQP